MEAKEPTNMSRHVSMKIQAKETESLESISEITLVVTLLTWLLGNGVCNKGVPLLKSLDTKP